MSVRRAAGRCKLSSNNADGVYRRDTRIQRGVHCNRALFISSAEPVVYAQIKHADPIGHEKGDAFILFREDRGGLDSPVQGDG